MKILILIPDKKFPLQRTLWNLVVDEGKNSGLFKAELMLFNVKDYIDKLLKNIIEEEYDRVVLDGSIGRIRKEFSELKHIDNLVFYNTDFYHQYMPESRYYGKLIPLSRRFGPHKMIVTNLPGSFDLKSQGFDSAYIPKAYDPTMIFDKSEKRDIYLGFIGALRHPVYRQRRVLLERLRDRAGLQILRTEKGKEYNDMLNRIKIFVNADIGMNEYMVKNFEAMAAGCLLATYSASNEENELLGFVDMENVVLYKSEDELLSKLEQLEGRPELVERITEAGQLLVTSQHSWRHRVPDVIQAICRPIKSNHPSPRLLDYIKTIRYGIL